MDAHDANRIFIFANAGRLSKIGIILFQFFNIADKIKQTLVTGLFKSCRLLHQHVQIRLTNLSCRHSRYIIVIAGLFKNAVQQTVYRQVSRLLAKPCDQCKKIHQFNINLI